MSKNNSGPRWAVVTVYIHHDGWKPLVHIVETFPNFQFAKTKARDLAEEMYKTWKNSTSGVGYQDFTFDDVWCKVGTRRRAGLFDDWGFSPVEDLGIDEEIRVVPYEE